MKAVFALVIVAALVALSFQQSTTTIESKTEPKTEPKVEPTIPSSGPTTTTIVLPTTSLKPDQKLGKRIGFSSIYFYSKFIYIKIQFKMAQILTLKETQLSKTQL